MKIHKLFDAAVLFAMIGLSPGALRQAPPEGDRTIEAAALIKPGKPATGENTVEITFTEGSKLLTGIKLVASVGMTNMDMGTSHPTVKESPPGHYLLKPMFLMDGPWRVSLTSKEPKFTLSLDFSAGSGKPWQPVKRSIRIESPAPGTPAVAKEPPKPHTPTQMPAAEGPATPSVPTAKAPPDGGKASYSGMGQMGDVSTSMPRLKERSSYSWAGTEDWETRTGFGKNEPMVRMMILMMVGGSGMEGMKMAPMDLVFGETNFLEGDGQAQAQAQTSNMKPKSLKVTSSLDAARVGDNTVNIKVLGPDTKPVMRAKIAASVAMTSMDMGTAHPQVKEKGNGEYRVTAPFTMAGPWRLTLTVTAAGLPPETSTFDFEAK